MSDQTAKKLLAELIRWALHPPAQPGEFALTVVGEHMRKNVTRITLAPLPEGNPDNVVGRRFRIDTTANPPVQIWFQQQDPTVAVPDQILEQGVEVKLSLVDLDQALNEGPARELVFTPSDVTPPRMPGSFSLEVVGENP